MKAEMNFDNIGGGIIAVDGTFSTTAGVQQTFSVDGLTNIDTFTFRQVANPDNFGFAKKYGSPNNDTIKVAVGGSTLYTQYGVVSLSGNQVTFLWGGNQSFVYTAYGS